MEVELKGRLRDRARAEAWLSQRSAGVPITCDDTYFDYPDLRLEHRDHRQLRLRRIITAEGVRHMWTVKFLAPGDAGVADLETTVADIDTAAGILAAVGLTAAIAYTKVCVKYGFDLGAHPVTVTLEQITDLPFEYLEIEVPITGQTGFDAARAVAHAVLDAVGVEAGDLDPTCHVELVRHARASMSFMDGPG